MQKEIRLDVIKKEFEKGTLDQQIEKYHELGDWIHKAIEDAQNKLSENAKKLNGK